MVIVMRKRLKGKLYAALCTREENGEWEDIIDSIVIELVSYPEHLRTPHFYEFFYKVSILNYLSFKYYRNSIFDLMAMLDRGEVDGL